MLKQLTSKMMNATLLAMLASAVMLLSSASALALSVDPFIVPDASSQPVMHGIRHAQNNWQNTDRQNQNDSEKKRALRSRSEVMQEVKRRYSGAEILKITLNRNGTSYNVRVLMPSGKVRSLQISALR